ncbi:Uncharacterised protein [uncultured archaeon]|nr:Uncharacterised protein [uncultured archaeon]
MGDDCFTPCNTDAILGGGETVKINNTEAPVKLNNKLLQKRRPSISSPV